MKAFSTLLLMGAFLASADPLPAESRASGPPSFFTLETPLQMAGQAGGGVLGALVAGSIGAGIGSKNARQNCLDGIDPDLSDECAWSGLGGALGGFMIGAPIGHALGALTVGLLQDKHGAPIAALSAVAGDVALVLIALGLHSALDGKILPNGGLDPILVPMTIAGMVAIPIVTQSFWDYRVRVALQPGLALGAAPEDNRYLLRLVDVRF
jgi:hypothetical protein